MPIIISVPKIECFMPPPVWAPAGGWISVKNCKFKVGKPLRNKVKHYQRKRHNRQKVKKHVKNHIAPLANFRRSKRPPALAGKGREG
jgi:hypothetical protein